MIPRITENRSWLPPDVIESKAVRLLHEYEAEFGEVSLPVPVEHMIEAKLGLTIDWDEIADSDDDAILAEIVPGLRVIRMNSRHRGHFESFLGTERFTFAHEVGHWVLHVQEASEVQLPLFSASTAQPFICSGSSKDNREWQASRFAAALIMPDNMVRSIASSADIHSWGKLYELRDQFQVTISALVNRLKELQLLYVSPDRKLFPSQEVYNGQQSFL